MRRRMSALPTIRASAIYADTAQLRVQSARLRAEAAAVIERSRALRWETLVACARIRPISGGSDEPGLVVSVISGTSLCRDCIAAKTSLDADQVAAILTTVAATIAIAASTGQCAGCLETKQTFRLEVAGSRVAGESRPRTTQQAILQFLRRHAGSAFCAACVSAKLFAGKDIDVAMRHLEGSGVLRQHGRCSECARARLVASLPGTS
jgi:hypothetical protein